MVQVWIAIVIVVIFAFFILSAGAEDTTWLRDKLKDLEQRVSDLEDKKPRRPADLG